MSSAKLINHLKQWLHLSNEVVADELADSPIPSKLYNADQLERHGISLALSHTLAKKNSPDMLLKQLAASEAILLKSCDILAEKKNEGFSPAREWLLDNFYIIQEQIQAIRRHLPKGYGNKLPQLAGSIPGYPRVYDIAQEIIEHGDGRWDLDSLTRFITAYQSETTLTLGELWAIPITLGVALIKNLRMVSQRIVADMTDRNLADEWADRMIDVAVSEPKKLVIVIADMARSDPNLSCAFVTELARRLQGAALSFPLSWIEQHLLDEGLTVEQLVQEENKYQAANQVTVSNGIESLRRLGEVDWRDFVEAMSAVEHILRTDPTDTYSKMDFGTRDRYRHVVERLSRLSKWSEPEVAAKAIELANTKYAKIISPSLPHNDKAQDQLRECHVGFYLIDAGLPQLEKNLHHHCSVWQKSCRIVKHWVLQIYLGSITLITAGLVYALISCLNQAGISQLWLWVIGIAIALLGSQLAASLVNLIATLLVKPMPLPRMDFSKGIPSTARTLVAVPAMLSSKAAIEALTEALEVRFLGNRDDHLHFMLLTDFNDASQEVLPSDAALLAFAKEKIDALNKQYAREESDIFFLCHRARQWNPSENVWMGKERKRGKLLDLNNLLRENNQTGFSLIVGRTEILNQVKYVITLDSDTQLSRESARLMVATMTHLLNQPLCDAATQRIVKGYGILQPRIAETLSLHGQTRYVRLCGSEFGIDPYTRAVSNVYQDLFHEGSFFGKGIYDVEVFQKILGQQFPNNRILSHDLLEGCYLHSGFISDVPLYERSPGSYLADVKRRIRWIRGDWQLISYLLPNILNIRNQWVTNPLSILSKYKILDNLLRSLVAVALLLLFGLTWTILPATFFWSGLLLAIVAFPAIVKTLLELICKPTDMLASQHVTTNMKSASKCLAQFILYLACLPHEAWYSLVAIIRTCWRLIVSKQHLLEWTPSDQVDQHLKNSLPSFIANMWMCPAAALTALIVLTISNREALLLFTTPLLVLWFIAPLIAWWVSQLPHRKEPKLDSSQIRFLHQMARKTWYFFETFMNADNHWLPPDNYQQEPIEALAQRTSPTNMGLALLANLTAYDFGYITMGQLLERTSNTLQTISCLERYRGHFYNWYNTATLAPLLPRYVSTVDSGNLAGHLLTLRQGLLALLDEPLLTTCYLNGLEDTFDILSNFLKHPELEALKPFKQLLSEARLSFSNWIDATSISNKLCSAAEQITKLFTTSGEAATEWSNKLLLQCYALQNELNLFSHVPDLNPNITLGELAAGKNVNLIAQSDVKNTIDNRMNVINSLAAQLFSLSQMDMSFLYDEASHLLTIGFNIDTQRRDPSNYDLLSSEARFGSFVAIAQGQVSQDNWFALGRLLVSTNGEPILISWSGSMFEYLMPLLVMPTYQGTLLDQTYHAAVNKQIAYGKQRGVVWGISESGYNAVDTQYNYLYRAFGVPGLGLKRGLEEDLVIAPYASAMALMVAPEAACHNLQRLAKEYAVGKFGFYEAIDFTASRLPPERKKVLVRSFMAHHQGMSFLAFSYLLHHQPMQKRFVADPLFQATLLLLQERIPKPAASYLKIPKSPDGNAAFSNQQASIRIFNTPNTRTPQVQLLSNGSYHLLLTQAGGGYSRWKEIAVTRWREDSTCDNWGLFSYVRDVETGEYWSTSYQPTVGVAENFKSIFSESQIEFSRTDNKLDMHTEVVVSPEDDIELRRLRIHNRAKIRRMIEFTSYAEVVLAPQATDLAQPSFSNLFVETELLPEKQTILATRRSATGQENTPWLCHLLNVYSDQSSSFSFETDRSRFVGRGRTLAAPLAMIEQDDLSNTSGAVLDPIVAIRCRVMLEPDDLVIFDLLTGVADTKDHCLTLVEKYHDRHLANRIFGLAWTHGQVLLHHLNISEANAQLYGKLASAIVYASSSRRADPRILASNRGGQSSLWGYSISGDLPIVLLHIEDAANIELVRQLIQAQAYWRRKGLLVDVVILNEEHVSYRQTLQDQIMSLITGSGTTNQGCNIVVRVAEQVPSENTILLQSVARVILSDRRGTLKEQLGRRRVNPPVMPLLKVGKLPRSLPNKQSLPFPPDLQFFNGLGGFNATGDEYFIQLKENLKTPAPWVNVLANPYFGTLVSEAGQAYTWTENAHEFRLTPWDNDPLIDSAGEAFYLRDDETGLVWSPTSLPCPGTGNYQTRHGFGYSVFEHIEAGIYSETWMYVAQDAPIKFVVLKIRNNTSVPRRLSVAGYVAWVLGDTRAKNAMYVVTELSQGGAIMAQNHYNTDFGERTAFFDATTNHLELLSRTVTADRTEFLGRNGTYHQPAGLKHKRLSGRVGAGLDPCAAILLTFDLAEGQTRDIVFTLGAGQNRQEAETLVQRYQGTAAAQSALTAVRRFWQETLSGIQVKTPDPSINLLANGWLLYQVLSSRLWGRTGYYQSGGAFGFRDQLQDVMALAQVKPALFRAHILLCAAHQFEEGDVQHWWHPPQSRGVRTRCSDDYLWLPFAICHYIETTGDTTILDESIPFLQGRPLKEDEESYYELPIIGSKNFSLYEHAQRAIHHGLKFGAHGLPLIGSGDWNDGMNMVGKDGRGESVWLGFFLYSVLKFFAPLATHYGDNSFAAQCEEESKKLKEQIELHAWDGQWYRRAYFDDGSPLGSASNIECRIDSIAQSWSVLSGAAETSRAKEAMLALHRLLVNESAGLIKLLDPPFDKSTPTPGYIEGYLPGIRENGGQYTHAAIWAAMGFAKIGEKELAWQSFNILNPINHGRNLTEIERYKIEPYVIAGDVYSVVPHIGRGGWSWYTGSAGWLYRLITETLLGVQLEKGNQLILAPLLPDSWDGFSVSYKYGKALYYITINRHSGQSSMIVDETLVNGTSISLVDDGQSHHIILNILR